MREYREESDIEDGIDNSIRTQTDRRASKSQLTSLIANAKPDHTQHHSSSPTTVIKKINVQLPELFVHPPASSGSGSPLEDRSRVQAEVEESSASKVMENSYGISNLGTKRKIQDFIVDNQKEVRPIKLSRKAPDERRERFKNLASRPRPPRSPLRQRSQVSSPTPAQYTMQRSKTMIPVSQLEVPSLRRTASARNVM